MNIQAAGPIGKILETDGTVVKARQGYQLAPDANALIMLHRVAFPEAGPDGSISMSDKGEAALLRWAADSRLGQHAKHIEAVVARREQAVAALREAGHSVARLSAEPLWRLAVGLGNRGNAHEIGLSLHGTYGWPVLPGSSLKGLAARWAAESGAKDEELARIFGAPRLRIRKSSDETERDTDDEPAGDESVGGEPRKATAARGSVRFLDAIPARGRVTVTADVLTPHVKPYYETAAADSRRTPVPPAEYHNPVPVSFLAVSGKFAVDLYGPSGDVDAAARWLTEAADELGAGAKTAAGYGYMKLTRLPDPEGRT